jgi:hypothetical protein
LIIPPLPPHAPDAPHDAACAGWRRMPPHEVRRCLMKPEVGNWLRDTFFRINS